jgi:hypothetical protein
MKIYENIIKIHWPLSDGPDRLGAPIAVQVQLLSSGMLFLSIAACEFLSNDMPRISRSAITYEFLSMMHLFQQMPVFCLTVCDP